MIFESNCSFRDFVLYVNNVFPCKRELKEYCRIWKNIIKEKSYLFFHLFSQSCKGDKHTIQSKNVFR